MAEQDVTTVDPWWVRGVLYENCNCQLLCPAHISFKQRCDNETCVGFWGIHVTKGRFGQLTIDEQNAVVAYDTPAMMHTEESWRMEIYLDQAADEEQRNALEKILTGEAGGPWRNLAKFVADRWQNHVAPIEYENDGKRISLRIGGVLESAIESVESKKTGQIVTLDNLFNIIHAETQFLATGTSMMKDDVFEWATERKHALFSQFSWTGP
ncbi:MAG: DUF1326 domain-containing protein [Rhodospirillales bacterium]